MVRVAQGTEPSSPTTSLLSPSQGRPRPGRSRGATNTTGDAGGPPRG